MINKNQSNNKTEKSVSAVIPCYNCSLTIERCVESILKQTLPVFEIILVDDASTDSTSKVLSDVLKKNPNIIKVISLNENGGASNARNIGWDRAIGDYVAFLDADDTWHSEKLRVQIKFMEKKLDISISGHTVDRAEEGGGQEACKCVESRVLIIKKTSLLFYNSFSTCSIVVRRSVPLRFSKNKRYSEDLSLWLEFAFSGHDVAYIKQSLAFVHKPLWGHSGLSSHLLKMEQGELGNFIELFKKKKISAPLLILAISWSILKFLRRLTLVSLRKLVCFRLKV